MECLVTTVAPPPQVPTIRRGTKRERRRERDRVRKSHGLKPVRRWPKRAFIAIGSLLIVLILLIVGTVMYVRYRLDQVKTATCSTCVAAAPGQPFTVLLIGSDSRAFVDNSTEEGQFGDSADAGGQRSDVTIVARVVPATHQIMLMSIPRDLWVNIPGKVPDVSGMNRINAAFNNGPSLLAETIQDDLGIPINDFAEINFPGLQGMVNSIGGIYLNFSVPVKDAFSGLKITNTGCQLVNGTQALALVRSRHLFYFENGTWNADVQSDFSRIQRQDVFFRSMIDRLHAKVTNPLSINAFIGSLTTDITVNTAFKGQLLGLAEGFHGTGENGLKTETLPVTEFTNSYGEDVLQAAQPYAATMIKQFNAFGATSSGSTSSGSSSSATTTSTIPDSSIGVDVENGDGTAGLAGTVSTALHSAGFTVTDTGNGPSFSYTTSEIEYAPGSEPAAKQLASAISGATQLVSDPSLSGDNLIFIVGSTFVSVNSGGTAGSGGATGSTGSTGASGGSSTPPPNVVTNTQTEPWNPTVCNPT
jgi:LCP family protein required for cell wall assembly